MTVPDDDWEPEEPTDPIVNTDPLSDELMVLLVDTYTLYDTMDELLTPL